MITLPVELRQYVEWRVEPILRLADGYYAIRHYYASLLMMGCRWRQDIGIGDADMLMPRIRAAD